MKPKIIFGLGSGFIVLVAIAVGAVLLLPKKSQPVENNNVDVVAPPELLPVHFCGDGIISSGEECDPAYCVEGSTGGVYCSNTLVCPYPQLCSPNSCQCVPALEVTCGNGLLEPQYGEECDPSYCTLGSTGVFCGGVSTCGLGNICSFETCECEWVGPIGGQVVDQPPGPGLGSGGPGQRVHEPIPVYNCRLVGGDTYEWYEAVGEFLVQDDGSKAFLSAQITGGPYSGPWQPGCTDVPGGDGGDGSGRPPPPVVR